jgi:DNA-directed RNA polymerase specialized sigma24 family protein
VLVLRYLLDLDVDTVARTLDLTNQAVRSRSTRALARVRADLGSDFATLDAEGAPS